MKLKSMIDFKAKLPELVINRFACDFVDLVLSSQNIFSWPKKSMSWCGFDVWILWTHVSNEQYYWIKDYCVVSRLYMCSYISFCSVIPVFCTECYTDDFLTQLLFFNYLCMCFFLACVYINFCPQRRIPVTIRETIRRTQWRVAQRVARLAQNGRAWDS